MPITTITGFISSTQLGMVAVQRWIQFLVFLAMCERLRHSITVDQDGSEDAANAATACSHYCNKHVAATVIQRTVRMHSTQQKLKRAGWIWPTTTNEDRMGNKEAVARYRLCSQACEQISQKSLSGQTFVLIGAIPKSQSGKKYTQEQLGTLVKQLGGRIRPQLPKKATTHSYVVLTTQAVVDKAPTTVKESVRRGYQVLDFSYVVQKDLCRTETCFKEDYDINHEGNSEKTVQASGTDNLQNEIWIRCQCCLILCLFKAHRTVKCQQDKADILRI
jgi:hypothetical protein